jgi:quinol monooxygenase YgiN
MVIVAGYIVVDPQQRERYLAGCVGVMELARRAPGCLDFAISADLVEGGRINVFERWESQKAVEAFRGSGPSEEQRTVILAASVAEYEVARAQTADSALPLLAKGDLVVGSAGAYCAGSA